ncbi:siroheme synthase CysG [Spartinivicinus ruber]|uniref:siroheme synthase CysG n=1 Tax=Spartinivicinus ruber TaxID=2683272 RepID=UPI0013D78EBD|nr:siroheme synthase CysG [Spartinivicinus ruber]
MDQLPLFHNLKNRPCLLVGGGDVANRKAHLLLQAGAKLIVVAPQINDNLQNQVIQQGSQYHLRCFDPQDIQHLPYALVVAATNDQQVNQQVSQLAQQANIPVNVVDQPALSTVTFPAIIDRSPLTIAISSGGAAPVLARLLRGKIESLIPHRYGQLAELAGKFREKVKQRFNVINDRRYFWEKVLTGPIAEQAFAGKLDKAEQQLESALAEATPTKLGEVYLVGGGPGDPDLLTFRALRLMQQADVVLYDRLVSPEVLELVRRDADRLYVGKARSNHALPQAEINQRLIDLALEGKRVLRLKGGDPFIFGRGGEEIDRLAEAGIPFQVVPGITAASGCASYAGIPLTHRDYAQSVRFITGHMKEGHLELPWQQFTNPAETLVFYMGLMGLGTICQQLQHHGRSPDTPIALVQQGTTQKQRVYTGTLATIEAVIKDQEVKPPTLIIVGEVVSLQSKLAWFSAETK